MQSSPLLSGGVVTNVQFFATNSHGMGTPFVLFLAPTGALNISTRLAVGTGSGAYAVVVSGKGGAPGVALGELTCCRDAATLVKHRSGIED